MENLPKLGDWQGFEAATQAAIGLNDPLALLLADHEWLRSVISATDTEFRAGARIDTPELREAQSRIWGVIESHIRKEEDVVFPALQKLFDANGRSDINTEDMYGEHDGIRIRYEDLQEALDGGADATLPFRRLWKALVVHFDNEEQYIFDDARPLMTPEVGRELIARLTSAEFAPDTARR